MMVLMALAATFMTSPLLEAVCPDRMLRSGAEQSKEQLAAAPLGLNPAGD
jgi:hypothetical protein